MGMMIDLITAVIALSGDGDAPWWVLAAGPAGAAATYGGFYAYYRNTGKSHEFEKDTIIESQPVQGGEEKVDHIRKTRDSSIKGDNSSNYRKRVERIR